MGIGFVIIIWGIIFTILFAPTSFFIGLAVRWWVLRREGRVISFRRAMTFGIFPFILLVYGFFALIGYAFHCELVRKVDPGIGDGWQVPLGNDYYLCMIDTPEHGYLMRHECSGSPISDGISKINVFDHVVAGKAKIDFTLDLTDGHLAEFDAASEKFQIYENELVSVNQFYIERRWSYIDVIALLIIGIPALFFIKWWYDRIIVIPGASPISKLTAS